MHEHGVADEVFKVLLQQVQQHGASRIAGATIHVGEFSGITADALEHGIEHCCEHVDMPPFPITVIIEGPRATCGKCHVMFDLGENECCPECGGEDLDVTPATGVTIKSVDLE